MASVLASANPAIAVRSSSSNPQVQAILTVLGFVKTVDLLENDRRAALQAIRIAERYNRLCRYSQAAPSWLRLTDKYFQVQLQRGGQTLSEVEKREQIMVESMVDLTLQRDTEQA